MAIVNIEACCNVVCRWRMRSTQARSKPPRMSSWRCRRAWSVITTLASLYVSDRNCVLVRRPYNYVCLVECSVPRLCLVMHLCARRYVPWTHDNVTMACAIVYCAFGDCLHA